MGLRFRRRGPRRWPGYYRRIPGDTTAFHVPSNEGGRVLPFVYWDRAEGRGRCWMVESEAAYALADAVNAAKRELGGSGGGSFLINEHGQVLVPAPGGGGDVLLAGEIAGDLEFENPFLSGATFSLADDARLCVGDSWDRPYVGMWYNLAKYGQVYRMRMAASAQMKELPARQDSSLVRNLRSIRPYGAVRFIVNPHGIVLTKAPPDGDAETLCEEESWTTAYAGRIDPTRWFAKEG